MKLLIYVLVVVIFLFSGCTNDRLRVTREGVDIEVDISYLMQNKNFKSLLYNTNTGIITIENFSSETSEIISEVLNHIKVP